MSRLTEQHIIKSDLTFIIESGSIKQINIPIPNEYQSKLRFKELICTPYLNLNEPDIHPLQKRQHALQPNDWIFVVKRKFNLLQSIQNTIIFIDQYEDNNSSNKYKQILQRAKDETLIELKRFQLKLRKQINDEQLILEQIDDIESGNYLINSPLGKNQEINENFEQFLNQGLIHQNPQYQQLPISSIQPNYINIDEETEEFKSEEKSIKFNIEVKRKLKF